MRLVNRMLIAGGVLALPLLFVSLPGAHPVAATSQPGSVLCTALSGLVRFHPPLTNAGTTSEVATFKITLNSCTSSGGGAPPSGGYGSATLSQSTNSCANVAVRSSSPVSVAIRWSPADSGTTAVRFPGFAPLQTTNPGIRLGGRGTTASGSYTGRDGGASSTARVIWGLSANQIDAACGTRSGLKVLKIQSGSLRLK